MHKRPILRVMLSLLLLLAQQMSLAHGVSHGPAASAGAVAGVDDGPCGQCLAFADLEPAPGADRYCPHLMGATASPPPASPLPAPCARTVCVFLSRAPPLA